MLIQLICMQTAKNVPCVERRQINEDSLRCLSICGSGTLYFPACTVGPLLLLHIHRSIFQLARDSLD